MNDVAAVDPARPTYHYSSGNWMNDVIPYFDGERTHVFYIHNPLAASRTRFSWGHASTTDLVTWRTQPVALSPRPGADDEFGCWTGTVFETRAGPVASYTGVRSFAPFVQTQCLATTSDLDVWEQTPAAVITDPPDGFGDCFRDPFVYPYESGWRMLVGSAVMAEPRAAVLMYDSADLATWTFSGTFFVVDSGELGPIRMSRAVPTRRLRRSRGLGRMHTRRDRRARRRRSVRSHRPRHHVRPR